MAMPTSVALGAPRGSGILKRLASAVVLLPVFLLIVVKAPGWMFNTLVVVASVAALWELMRMFERGGRPAYGRLGVVAGTAVTASFGAARMLDPMTLPALTLALAVGAILAAPLWHRTPATEPAANTLLAVLYIGWLLGYAILLHHTSALG